MILTVSFHISWAQKTQRKKVRYLTGILKENRQAEEVERNKDLFSFGKLAKTAPEGKRLCSNVQALPLH
jgi:hypothetical protein